MGKTTFALNMLFYGAINGCGGVLLFSMEMPKKSILQKIISITTGKPLQQQKEEDVIRTEQILSEVEMFIDDSRSLSVGDICRKIRRQKIKSPNLGLVMIDYLGLLRFAEKIEQKSGEVGAIMQQFGNIARECNVCLLILCQLNREVEKRKNRMPMMSDLKDSGHIEQGANVVLLLYRSSMYEVSENENKQQKNNDKTSVIIAKNREGNVGSFSVMFQKDSAIFREVS